MLRWGRRRRSRGRRGFGWLDDGGRGRGRGGRRGWEAVLFPMEIVHVWGIKSPTLHIIRSSVSTQKELREKKKTKQNRRFYYLLSPQKPKYPKRQLYLLYYRLPPNIPYPPTVPHPSSNRFENHRENPNPFIHLQRKPLILKYCNYNFPLNLTQRIEDVNVFLLGKGGSGNALQKGQSTVII